MSHLSALKAGVAYHEHHDRRHPLGIYNVSVLRICEKICKCCMKLEQYFLLPPRISEIDKHDLLRDEILDLLELCLYAAAEHVDDVQLIVLSFFETPEDFKKSPHTKALNRAVKPLRDSITSITNAIKHQQGRLRLLTLEVTHDDIDMCLHGFFVEGFVDGEVGPSPILYENKKPISSVISLLWEVLIYLGTISREIGAFLEVIMAVDKGQDIPAEPVHFRDAVVALARLPLYSFDEMHPFTRVRLVLKSDGKVEDKVRSEIYGSIMRGWSKGDQIRFGNSRFLMTGDGVSCRFTIPRINQLHLQHWT